MKNLIQFTKDSAENASEKVKVTSNENHPHSHAVKGHKMSTLSQEFYAMNNATEESLAENAARMKKEESKDKE